MKTLKCDGFFDNANGRYVVNMSTILSFLIREVGRKVDRYNSDILYDIDELRKCVESKMEDGKKDFNRTFLIGLRESGVDGNEFVTHCRGLEDYSRGLYRIDVKKTSVKCTVSLSETNLNDLKL